MKKRLLCLALPLALLLTACGGSAEPPQSQASLLESAAGMDEAVPILTVDGREIPAWRYLYWLAETCSAMEEEYAAAGMELDWNASAESGTLKTYAKDQALEAAVLYAVVENWAETYGCKIDVEMEAEKMPAKWGLTDIQRRELEAIGLQYRELYQLFCREGSALAPEAGTAEAFAQEQGWVGVERLFVSVEGDREMAKEQAARWFAELNAAEDMAAEFARIAAEDDNLCDSSTIRLGDGAVDPALEEALQGLETGQISGILETDEGFHILRRVLPEKRNYAEVLIDDTLNRAVQQAEIRCTQTYKDLDAKEFYTALLEKNGDESRGLRQVDKR